MWAGIAIPIVVLYVLRSRLKKQPVSTLLFWDQLFDQKRQRSWWQRLRHLLSLLLQLAFLALIVSALLDPLWSGQKQKSRQIVLIVDNSASMSAAAGEPENEPDDESVSDGVSDGNRDGVTTRFTRAIEAAGDVVRELRDGDEIALVTAGGTVRVVVGMTDFGPAVRDALKKVEPTDGPTRVNEAVEAARRMTGAVERREIVLVSDGGFNDFESLVAAEDVRLISVGGQRDNVAITRMSVRRSLVDPIGYAMLLEVVNFSDDASECRLSIDLGGELVDVYPLQLAAGEVWRKTIVGASAEGGTLRAEIEIDDGLAVDNVARVMLPTRGKIPVTLVTEEPSLYLESVFTAIPLIELEVTNEMPTQSPDDGFLVLHRINRQEINRQERAFPGGRVLVIDPQSDSPYWQLGPPVDGAIVVTQDKTSPLMPHVNLQNVLLPGARGLEIMDGATTLLTAVGGETLMASIVGGDDRVVVLSAKLDDGDLPLRIAFPVMMTNAVNWFLSRSGEIEPALQTGELAKVPVVGGGEGSWTWTGPDGEVHLATTEEESILVGPVDRVGLVSIGNTVMQAASLPVDAAPVKTLAVNLCDASESDLRSRGEIPIRDDEVSGAGYRSIWFYLTCLAIGLIVAEWFLYQRRIVA